MNLHPGLRRLARINARIRRLTARWTGGLLALQLLLSGLCLMPQQAHAGAAAMNAAIMEAGGMTDAAMPHCPGMSHGGMMDQSGGCAHCDQPDTALGPLPALDAPALTPLAVLQPASANAAARPAAFDLAAAAGDAGPGGGAFLLYRTTQRLRI